MIPPALSAALDADPSDHGIVLAIADLLEGEGDERAQGLRWLVENGKRPTITLPCYWFMFIPGEDDKPGFDNSSFLPLTVADYVFEPPNHSPKMIAHRGWHGSHDTPSAAYIAAASEIIKPEYNHLRSLGVKQ